MIKCLHYYNRRVVFLNCPKPRPSKQLTFSQAVRFASSKAALQTFPPSKHSQGFMFVIKGVRHCKIWNQDCLHTLTRPSRSQICPDPLLDRSPGPVTKREFCQQNSLRWDKAKGFTWPSDLGVQVGLYFNPDIFRCAGYFMPCWHKKKGQKSYFEENSWK